MPTLIFDGKRFVFRCGFAERALARENGFRWDAETKTWYTENLAVALRLRDYAADSTRSKFEKILLRVSPWSKPLPPPPPGLELMAHQRDAVKFVLERNRSYLGLDPGLGKTAVAATVARALKANAAYISPPFLVKNVLEEFNRWAPEVSVRIVSDAVLDRDDVREELKSGEIIFVDEAHRFKSETAKRTRALLGDRYRSGIVDGFKRQVYLSGTPMPNRPMELFSILSKAAPETIDFMGRFDFGRRYCAGHQNAFGWDFSGASNLPELKRKIVYPSGPFMLRLKKDLLDLPPKIEETFVVSDELSPRLAVMDRELGAVYTDVEDLIKKRIAAEVGREGEELHLATYRRLLGKEKVGPALEYIQSLLDETEENILVFAFHKEVIRELESALSSYKPLVITGDTPVGLRHAMVREFQTLSDRRIMIGNYQAMGVGFTLTNANRVIFVEFDWVPGVNEQAADRAHRIGQKGTVLVQYVVYRDSLDKAVIGALLRKRRAIKHI